MKKEEYYLILPVERYVELDDKDLEDINFHGGVICFRLYISKMIENKFKTNNSKIEVESIEWRKGRDVIYVKFIQTYTFNHDPIYNAACSFLKERGFEDYSISIQYQHYMKKYLFVIKVESSEKDSSILEKKLRKSEFIKALTDVEPDFLASVMYTIVDPETKKILYSF